MALRSMQGTCTSPQTGSHVSPRWCSRPISAAYSICEGVPPKSWHAAAAAMAHATPTSPWQPTSAPEIEELVLAMLPKSPAVARARRMRMRRKSREVARW